MKRELVTFFLFVVLFQTACNKYNCNGADTIYSLNRILLVSEDSSEFEELPRGYQWGIFFRIDGILSSRDGTRNCRQQDYVVEYEDVWDENSLSFSCNKDLQGDSQTFLANTELVGTSIIETDLVLKPQSTLQKGQLILWNIKDIEKTDSYTFTVTMKTRNGKQFSASKMVYIAK